MFRVFVGDGILPSYVGIVIIIIMLINHEIRIPNKQPGFKDSTEVRGFFFVAYIEKITVIDGACCFFASSVALLDDAFVSANFRMLSKAPPYWKKTTLKKIHVNLSQTKLNNHKISHTPESPKLPKTNIAPALSFLPEEETHLPKKNSDSGVTPPGN